MYIPSVVNLNKQHYLVSQVALIVSDCSGYLGISGTFLPELRKVSIYSKDKDVCSLICT